MVAMTAIATLPFPKDLWSMTGAPHKLGMPSRLRPAQHKVCLAPCLVSNIAHFFDSPESDPLAITKIVCRCRVVYFRN
jgi:hypothetical protein